MKQLSKDEMKKVIGGFTEPIVDIGGGESIGCYKCCWNGTESCSKCVQNDGTGPCQSGATLKSCSSPCPYQ